MFYDNDAVRRGREFPTRAHAKFVADLTAERDALRASNEQLRRAVELGIATIERVAPAARGPFSSVDGTLEFMRSALKASP